MYSTTSGHRPDPHRQKNLLRRLLYEREFQQFAERHPHLKGLDMVEQVLEHLQIRCTVPAHDLEQIPRTRPLSDYRQPPHRYARWAGADVCRFSRSPRCQSGHQPHADSHPEPLSSLFIPVDNMGGRTRKSSLQQMENHLQRGGVLIFFPAGEVSRVTRKGIRDKSWHTGFIKLANKFRAPLLPAPDRCP